MFHFLRSLILIVITQRFIDFTMKNSPGLGHKKHHPPLNSSPLLKTFIASILSTPCRSRECDRSSSMCGNSPKRSKPDNSTSNPRPLSLQRNHLLTQIINALRHGAALSETDGDARGLSTKWPWGLFSKPVRRGGSGSSLPKINIKQLKTSSSYQTVTTAKLEHFAPYQRHKNEPSANPMKEPLKPAGSAKTRWITGHHAGHPSIRVEPVQSLLLHGKNPEPHFLASHRQCCAV